MALQKETWKAIIIGVLFLAVLLLGLFLGLSVSSNRALKAERDKYKLEMKALDEQIKALEAQKVVNNDTIKEEIKLSDSLIVRAHRAHRELKDIETRKREALRHIDSLDVADQLRLHSELAERYARTSKVAE